MSSLTDELRRHKPYAGLVASVATTTLAADELDRLTAENERLREAGVGYSQQTVDTLQAEIQRLLAENHTALVRSNHLLQAVHAMRAELSGASPDLRTMHQIVEIVIRQVSGL